MNCIQNLEKQVGQSSKMLEKTEYRQINGQCQHESDAITANLQKDVENLSMKVEGLEKKIDRQEWYSR